MESHGGYMLQMNSADVLTYPSEGLFSFNSDEIRTTSGNNNWSFNRSIASRNIKNVLSYF